MMASPLPMQKTSPSIHHIIQMVLVQLMIGIGSRVLLLLRWMELQKHAGSLTSRIVDEVRRDCRICHLSLDGDAQDSGIPIVLGCSSKDDLAVVPRHGLKLKETAGL